MISETFLNNCFELIFASKRQELSESVYQDILYYLNFIKKKVLDSGDVPVTVRNKFDLLKNVCEHKSNGGSMMEIVAALMLSAKFKQYESFINFMSDHPIDEKEKTGRIETIQNLVAWCKLSNTYKRFAAYNDVVIQGNFDTVKEVINEWNDMVKSAFTDVAEYELKSSNELVSSLNTCDDSLEPILEEIRKKYSRQNVITSGISELDHEFLSGGFQPSRVNLFLGTSGIGKSLILLNMTIRAAMSTPQQPGMFNFTGLGFDDGPERVFLYITMENYPYETWCRLYCSMFNKTKEEMLKMIYNRSTSSENIRAEIHKMMAPFNSSIQIDYFAANTISPATISALIQKYNQRPEKKIVKAVYIDYLDLLVPDVGGEFYRLDLGEITSSLKSIAARFEVPIITATQLNREAYRKSGKQELGAEMISESMQKLFIADFSAVMVKDTIGDGNNKVDDNNLPKKVTLKIDKNRDGKTGQIHIYFDYAKARLLTKDEFNEEYSKVLKI